MALLVLSNDITNAHHIDAAAVDDLVASCHTIKRAGSNEAQSIWECHRTTSIGTQSVFHIVVAVPSEAYQSVKYYQRKLAAEGMAQRTP